MKKKAMLSQPMAGKNDEEIIAQIAVQTQGFTVISKSDCETLINRITTMIEGGNE